MSGPVLAEESPPLASDGEDSGDIDWISNSCRAFCVQRDRFQMRESMGFGLAALVVILIFILLTHLVNPPTFAILACLILVVLFGALALGFLIQFAPKNADDRAWYSPLRLGFSSKGIYVEYDPATAGKRIHKNSARTFLPWQEIDGSSLKIDPTSEPHRVQFTRAGDYYPPTIRSLSTELTDRIRRAFAARGRQEDLDSKLDGD